MRNYLKIILLITLLFGCKKDKNIILGCLEKNAMNYNSLATIDDGSCVFGTPFNLQTPANFPNMSIPKDNPLTLEGISLGKKLFYDPILSENEQLSCVSCHLQELAFSGPSNSPSNVNGIAIERDIMSLTNVGWKKHFAWNGRDTTLEGKIKGTLENPFGMNWNTTDVIKKIETSNEYQELYKKAFGEENITAENTIKALAQFLRTLISSESKFDRYLRFEEALTPKELIGFNIFSTEKGDCFHCHMDKGPFTDLSMHNIGLDSIFNFNNNGHYNVSNNTQDIGLFTTPTLRNVEFTAPYMHDGRFATLEEVVEHYNSGGKWSPTIDPNMKKVGVGLQLTESEKEALVSFLKTLSDSYFINDSSFQIH